MARKQIKIDGCNYSISVSHPVILSEDLICEILKRIPARSLMRFKCVCKDWMRLIRDPQFAEAHLSYFQARPEASYILLLGLLKGVSAADQKLVPINSPVPANHGLFRDHRPCSNIVDGLICLRSASRVVIYNLSTGEERDLPPTKMGKSYTALALGLDPVSKKYKVLHCGGRYGCEILTMARNLSWNDLLDVPKINPLSSLLVTWDHPIHIAGKIYFLERDPLRSGVFIWFFDLTTEKFGTIDPPSNLDAFLPSSIVFRSPSLAEFEGRLGFFACNASMWKEHNAQNRLHKFWVLFDMIWVERGEFWFPREKPWGSIGTGEVLLGSSKISLFDPKTSCWSKENVNIDPRSSNHYARISCNHVENILPLSNMD